MQGTWRRPSKLAAGAPAGVLSPLVLLSSSLAQSPSRSSTSSPTRGQLITPNEPTAAMMPQRGGGGGLPMAAIDYYRHGLFPPARVAVVGDFAADASSDVEDPPLDLPAANPAPPRGGRGAPHPPPPFVPHVPGAAAVAHWVFDEFERRHARRLGVLLPGEDERPSGKQADTGDDEATSKEGEAPLPEPEEVYEVLKAIPDLPRADLLRAYSVFLRDDRQFRCLMALPRDMRKDWLLMEITNTPQ